MPKEKWWSAWFGIYTFNCASPYSLRTTSRTILFYFSQPKIDPGKAHIHCQVDLESKNSKESTRNILLSGRDRAGNYLGRTTICHLNQWWVRCVCVRLINDTFYRGTGMVTSRDGLPNGPRPRGPWAQRAPKPEPVREVAVMYLLFVVERGVFCCWL